MYLSVCTWSVHMHLHLSYCVYAASSLKFQCFEIKPEDDINECSHDDKPSSGMLAGFDEQILFRVFCICFAVSSILFLYHISFRDC